MHKRTFGATSLDVTLAEDLEPFKRAQLNRNAQGLLFVLLGCTTCPESLVSSPVELLPLLLLLMPPLANPCPRHILQSLFGGGWVISAADWPFLLQFSPQSCGLLWESVTTG